MNNTEFAKKLIAMIPPDEIDELLNLSPEVSKSLQKEIAKHVQQIAKESILAKTEVRNDPLHL